MFWNLINSLFGERTQNSEQVAAPKTTIHKDSGNSVENLSDIQRLERKYSDLHEGMIIETSLQEMLAVVPRHRARTDAYDSLVKLLESDYKVKLIITSRKHKTLKNKKQ